MYSLYYYKEGDGHTVELVNGNLIRFWYNERDCQWEAEFIPLPMLAFEVSNHRQAIDYFCK